MRLPLPQEACDLDSIVFATTKPFIQKCRGLPKGAGDCATIVWMLLVRTWTAGELAAVFFDATVSRPIAVGRREVVVLAEESKEHMDNEIQKSQKVSKSPLKVGKMT